MFSPKQFENVPFKAAQRFQASQMFKQHLCLTLFKDVVYVRLKSDSLLTDVVHRKTRSIKTLLLCHRIITEQSEVLSYLPAGSQLF